MLQSGIPVRFSIPWGKNAGGSYIRTIPSASQIGVTNGAASLNDGYPPLCFQPVASGGTPPFGQDTNGILNWITQWSQWQAAGGPIVYDSTFSTAIGGYPKGAVLASSVTAGLSWVSTADNNTTNPDSSGTNWSPQGAASIPIFRPQGRLTLAANTPVIAADVTAATVVYYTAFEGNMVPIYNGSVFLPMSFASDLALSLASSASANGIVDVFAFNNSGTLTLGYGPVWATATAGSGARGTGGGTTEITRVNGIWVNKNTITLINGANTYSSLAAYTCTYLGSIWVDGTNGQVSCTVSYGQNRKWGVWNAYNRKSILLQAGDSTASWTYNTATWRGSNNSANNNVGVFTGIAEEMASIYFVQNVSEPTSNGYTGAIGIGVNSTSAISGFAGGNGSYASGAKGTAVAQYPAPPALGVNKFQALENAIAASSLTFYGTSAGMLLTASYLG